ncbi:MAG: extracellular solute-binding protein, partial [Neisseriaceae bacterium]|nr:extracellular solute-binding protein [Neisseriaceae bacterium]
LEHPLYARLLTDLKAAAGNGAFTYGGRADDANALFVSGKCATFTGSSASRAEIAANGQFDFGIAPLPYYDDVAGAPQNSIIGGASLWVFNNKATETYQGVVQFFHYLAQPEMAAQWHQKTGYVPVVTAAYALTQQAGFYAKTPGADVAVKQLDVTTTDQSRGIRLGSLNEIRDVEEGNFENIFNGRMTVAEALADMQKRSNEILSRFESTVSK